MKSKEFKKWLAAQGATFKAGQGQPLESLSERAADGAADALHRPKDRDVGGDQENPRPQIDDRRSVKMNLNFPVELAAAKEGGFVVTFPDVPEAITQGEDEKDALAHAVDALETALEFYTEGGVDLPKPGKQRRGQRLVSPSALVAVKLAIYQTMRDEGVRKSELARRLKWHMPQVDRLLDIRHASRLDQAEAALQALGHRLEVSVT